MSFLPVSYNITISCRLYSGMVFELLYFCVTVQAKNTELVTTKCREHTEDRVHMDTKYQTANIQTLNWDQINKW